MKKYFYLKIVMILVILLSLVVPANAAVDAKLQSQYAQDLVTLKLLKGYADGSLGLQNNIKRSEFVTFVVRMLGYENSTEANGVTVSFKDIDKKHWAYNNIKVAIKLKLISGYPDNTVGPEKNVTYSEALTVLVRALGYEKTLSGKWPDNVISKAAQLGISKDVSLSANKQITRGEMAVLVHNSLTVDFNK